MLRQLLPWTPVLVLWELSGFCHVGVHWPWVGRIMAPNSSEGIKNSRKVFRKENVVNIAADHAFERYKVEVQSTKRSTSVWHLGVMVTQFQARVVLYCSWHASTQGWGAAYYFCLVEQTLNLRLVSSDSCNLNAITPNHFLLREYSTGILSLVGNNEFNHRKHYASAQSFANAI